MKTIYKYTLKIADQQIIELPKGWEVISAQNQNGFITMWVIVEPGADMVDACFAIYGTGHPMRNINQSFIATIQMGNLVWHLFLVN